MNQKLEVNEKTAHQDNNRSENEERDNDLQYAVLLKYEIIKD